MAELRPQPTIRITDKDKFDPVKQKELRDKEKGLKVVTEEKIFTSSAIHDAWNEFVRNGKGNSRIELLFNKRAIIVDKAVITVEFDSEIQLEQLNDIKEDLMYFIRSKVENKTIVLNAKLKHQEEKALMYTSKERYEALKEKYPLIEELKKDLGLDFEF